MSLRYKFSFCGHKLLAWFILYQGVSRSLLDFVSRITGAFRNVSLSPILVFYFPYISTLLENYARVCPLFLLNSTREAAEIHGSIKSSMLSEGLIKQRFNIDKKN